ncbi:tRNA (adenosine(37)-N6)-threonylcarbamoyltransferase complex dimerization subunit type 1 TsaB [Candidatus Odyssella acanthamoebae]|uniref:tRNA (adenosine(37)-N6)-threonylcarbamoyltransferase complex dimerization subunit type 1 TsaB n=1 Tax=Candidatus Odyssella acanthamoebae TaxID=91604 RepID=UPI0018DE65A4|nr:tRNA (adenosine(37)-N6)-threonylcarbamoyltransferase complex dimerization subunit type 1 TsaB [Candidatus Paracaedibacter acanthamoebae]
MTTQSSTILSFDSTGSQDSVAVRVNGQVHGKLLPKGGSGLQSAILVTELAQLLSDSERTLADIDVLCVVTGPGSFTGIRLGLATAQGLKLATNCSIFAPTLLDVLLCCQKDSIAVVDSKRGDYFVKMDGIVSPMTLEQVQQIALRRSIVSVNSIPGIEVVLLQQSIAQALITFYDHCDHREQFMSLEPFYIRTPEFSKKKPFIFNQQETA